MKLKYYVRGVGVGILFATIILAISFHIRIKNQNTLTDEQIIQEVKKRGLTESIVNDAADRGIYDLNLSSTEADTEDAMEENQTSETSTESENVETEDEDEIE